MTSLLYALTVLDRISATFPPALRLRFIEGWRTAEMMGRIGNRLQEDMVAAAERLAAWYDQHPVTKDGYTPEQEGERASLLMRGVMVVMEIERERDRPERVDEARELERTLHSDSQVERQAGRDLDEQRYEAWLKGYLERTGDA